MMYIGIDPGTHTGVAIWDGAKREFLELSTIPIHQALDKVKRIAKDNNDICVVFEDARQRTWFGKDRNNYKGQDLSSEIAPYGRISAGIMRYLTMPYLR